MTAVARQIVIGITILFAAAILSPFILVFLAIAVQPATIVVCALLITWLAFETLPYSIIEYKVIRVRTPNKRWVDSLWDRTTDGILAELSYSLVLSAGITTAQVQQISVFLESVLIHEIRHHTMEQLHGLQPDKATLTNITVALNAVTLGRVKVVEFKYTKARSNLEL